jgi:hypothetical protein
MSAQEAVLRTEWLPHYKDAHSSTVLLGAALEQTGDVGIADLLSERHYLRKAHKVHATALTRAGVKSVAPEGTGTLVARVAPLARRGHLETLPDVRCELQL